MKWKIYRGRWGVRYQSDVNEESIRNPTPPQQTVVKKWSKHQQHNNMITHLGLHQLGLLLYRTKRTWLWDEGWEISSDSKQRCWIDRLNWEVERDEMMHRFTLSCGMTPEGVTTTIRKWTDIEISNTRLIQLNLSEPTSALLSILWSSIAQMFVAHVSSAAAEWIRELWWLWTCVFPTNNKEES